MKLQNYRKRDLNGALETFFRAVHETASADYTTRQCAAWAPAVQDKKRWDKRLKNSYAVVARDGDTVMGFGNLEIGGYLDCLFVNPDYLRRGVATAIYNELEKQAHRQGNAALISDVSITAKPFFEHCGFVVVKKQQVESRGEKFTNYRMEKTL